jgi:transposase
MRYKKGPSMMTPLEARLTERVAALEVENKLLREKVDLLIRRIFGRSSEQMDDNQLMLLLQGGEEPKKDPASSANPGVLEAEIEKQAEQTRTKAKKPDRQREARVPQHLPVVEEVVEPEEVKAAPDQWRRMGEEVTEQLDYEPAKFLRRLIIRPKYVRLEQPHKAPVIAELNTLQVKSIAAPGLIAQVIVAKYCDHLPLYRQEQIYATRHGIDLPRQSLCRWLGVAADWLQPLYEQIKGSVTGGGYVQVDETPVDYLDPGNGKTQQGYLWTCRRPGGDTFFHWATSRAAGCLESLIPKDFTGTVQCDGYGAYPAFASRSEGRIELAACWAHVRRKFYEAQDNAPQQAGFILLQIQHLYRIEAGLRESRAGPQLRAAVRGSQSRMILERIGKVLERLKRSGRHLPKSALGRAIDYTLGLWSQLQVYVQNGAVEIDNNLVENAIRPTAIGKKNWLFIGEAQAGDRSAILYTIVEACRSRGLDPWTYLRDVLTRLPTMTNRQIKDILPAAWAKAQAETQREAR